MVRMIKVSEFYDNADNSMKQMVSCAGLSTDDKPTAGIATGSDFTEVDTGDVYFFNEVSGSWVKQFSFQG